MADDNPFDDLANEMAIELDAMGAKFAEAARQDASVPVEYFGSVVIRSVPGEHPRREFGNLIASIGHEVERVDNLIIVTIGAGINYAFDLQERMDRPIVSHLADQFPQAINDRIGDAMSRL